MPANPELPRRPATLVPVFEGRLLSDWPLKHSGVRTWPGKYRQLSPELAWIASYTTPQMIFLAEQGSDSGRHRQACNRSRDSKKRPAPGEAGLRLGERILLGLGSVRANP